MAQVNLISVPVYAIGGPSQTTGLPRDMAFPAQQLYVAPYRATPSTIGGVTINAQIQMFGNEPLYLTSLTVAQIITLANA